MVANDNAFGRDGVQAFKDALSKTGARSFAKNMLAGCHDRLHRLGLRSASSMR